MYLTNFTDSAVLRFANYSWSGTTGGMFSYIIDTTGNQDPAA